MDGSRGPPYYFAATGRRFLSKAHVNYLIIAFVMGFVFNILPILLLCFYPCRCFQRCLNRTRLRLQALHTFMDVLQGHYKTEPYDLRCFSGFLLIVQVLNLFIHLLMGPSQYYPMASYMLLIVVMSLAVARPFKNKWHNIINTALFTALLVTYLSIVFQLESDVMGIITGNNILHSFLVSVMTIAILIPPVYGFLLCIGRFAPIRINEGIYSKLFSKDINRWKGPSSHECAPLITNP